MAAQSDHGNVYRKRHSFTTTHTGIAASPPAQRARAVAALAAPGAAFAGLPPNAHAVLAQVRADLDGVLDGATEPAMVITQFMADEMSRLPDQTLYSWLYHRFRYDIYPQTCQLDDFPPYIQIEPASVCNYRCVFCYQTNRDFSHRTSVHMGTMDIGLFREIVDEVSSHIAFGALASRGEPLLCPSIGDMLAYLPGKFLNMKLNTNAYHLDEAACHSLLCGGLGTVVFSVDATDEKTYSALRPGGRLTTVRRNIERFAAIRNRHYPSSPLISRVSGVLYQPEHQNIDDMVRYWGDLVDQVTFVSYNPWENAYDSPATGVSIPCSELWRRLFVWFDGKVNPCDTDYMSHLSVGHFGDRALSAIWRGAEYEELRMNHGMGRRSDCFPCCNCWVT